MNSILIVDDELEICESIKMILEYENYNVDYSTSAIQGLEKATTNNFTAMLLDIQMPGKTGFELLESLDKAPRVVFTTAYDEYALKAFEFNALDYLLKPIHQDRLRECISKLSADIKDNYSGSESKLNLDDRVFVKDGERCWFVKLADVRLFESDGNYLKVYFDSNRTMIHKSLTALDKKLDERSFFRASRKHIINLSWVEGIESWFNGGLLVRLKGGDKIEVSRRQASKFKDRMSL